MANRKISELPEKIDLNSKLDISDSASGATDSLSENLLFLTAKENVSNDKLSFKNLKKSLLDTSLSTIGSQTVSSSKTFLDVCALSQLSSVTSTTQSFERNVNYSNTSSSLLTFEPSQIVIQANNKIGFLSRKNSNTFFSNLGCFNIRSSRDLGELNVSGNTFINKVYIKNKEGKHQALPFEDNEDENVCFSHPIKQGTLTETIYLPKRFKYKPIISVNLFQTSGVKYIPLSLSNVSEYKFDVRFASAIPSDDYQLHISAYAPSILPDSSTNTTSDAKQIQRFHTTVPVNALDYTVQFPFENQSKPSIHVTTETSGNIVPHRISSVMNNSYKIVFGAPIQNEHIIHTLSQEI